MRASDYRLSLHPIVLPENLREAGPDQSLTAPPFARRAALPTLAHHTL